VGFERKIPVFKRAKTVHDLDRVPTVIGRCVTTALIFNADGFCSEDEGCGFRLKVENHPLDYAVSGDSNVPSYRRQNLRARHVLKGKNAPGVMLN
jgi:hypothetical protein